MYIQIFIIPLETNFFGNIILFYYYYLLLYWPIVVTFCSLLFWHFVHFYFDILLYWTKILLDRTRIVFFKLVGLGSRFSWRSDLEPDFSRGLGSGSESTSSGFATMAVQSKIIYIFFCSCNTFANVDLWKTCEIYNKLSAFFPY